jgi:hypothetical protein
MKGESQMRNQIGFTVSTFILLCAGSAAVRAHNIKGVNHPTLATARLSSPSSATDRPTPVSGTSLSVACFNVQNTSPHDARITALGFDLPGELTGFALVSPTDSAFTLENEVGDIPYFPGVPLDFALLTHKRFASGNPHLGLAPSPSPLQICVSGPFPREAGGELTPIETLLNYVYVRFKHVGPEGELDDVGIWERRLPL